MLSTFLDKIPAAFSRRFLLGSFLPLALFFIGSLLVGYTCLAYVQSLAIWYSEMPTVSQGFFGVAAALTLGALALVLSGLRTLGREVFERNWLPPCATSRQRREQELERLRVAVDSAHGSRRAMRELRKRAIERLRTARQKGANAHATQCEYGDSNATHQAIAVAIQSKAVKGLDDAVEALVKALEGNDANSDKQDAMRLDEDQVALGTAIISEEDRLSAELAKKTAALENQFPGEQIYETRYAAVAGFLSTYASQRYGADYQILWPRLETVLRKENPELYLALEEASTQLDFHIAMTWLTGLFSMIWLLVLPFVGLNASLFLALAVFGPLLCWAWFVLGARSYRSLAEQVSTAVDVGRLKIFDAIGLRQPQSPRQERDYWENLGSVLAFGGMHTVQYASFKAEISPAINEHHVKLTIETGPDSSVPTAQCASQ